MKVSSAVESALALYRQPSLVRQIERSELPAGMIDVLRIAAGQEEGPELSTGETDANKQELLAASVFYLQTALFHTRANDARIMALDGNSTSQQLRDHKRLILKWLHPDRNNNGWENKLFNRALDAATRLELEFERDPMITLAISHTGSSRMRNRRRKWQHSQRQQRQQNVWLGLFSSTKRRAVLALVVAGIFGVITISFDLLPMSIFIDQEVSN
jgi:hypothetical protein